MDWLIELTACRCGFGLVGLEHPAFKGDAEEGPMIHFFVGNWSPSGGGQVANSPLNTKH